MLGVAFQPLAGLLLGLRGRLTLRAPRPPRPSCACSPCFRACSRRSRADRRRPDDGCQYRFITYEQCWTSHLKGPPGLRLALVGPLGGLRVVLGELGEVFRRGRALLLALTLQRLLCLLDFLVLVDLVFDLVQRPARVEVF